MLTNSFEAGEHEKAKYQHLIEMVDKDINAALKILQGKFKKQRAIGDINNRRFAR